jgi:hypothetical protein
MDALEAVLDLVKQNEELAQTLDTYEDWFESLVGRTVTIKRRHKNKTTFVAGEVEEFEPGEGWIVRCIEDDEILTMTLEDLLEGGAWIENAPEPRPKSKRRVHFAPEAAE